MFTVVANSTSDIMSKIDLFCSPRCVIASAPFTAVMIPRFVQLKCEMNCAVKSESTTNDAIDFIVAVRNCSGLARIMAVLAHVFFATPVISVHARGLSHR